MISWIVGVSRLDMPPNDRFKNGTAGYSIMLVTPDLEGRIEGYMVHKFFLSDTVLKNRKLPPPLVGLRLKWEYNGYGKLGPVYGYEYPDGLSYEDLGECELKISVDLRDDSV